MNKHIKKWQTRMFAILSLSPLMASGLVAKTAAESKPLVGSSRSFNNVESAAQKSILATRAKGSEAEWTFLVYMEADNNLNSFALKNLSSMSKVGSNDKLNILAQWNQPRKQGKWRYKVENSVAELDSHIPFSATSKPEDDLVDAMKWAAKNYPAKNYALILWNHGVGILDPVWGNRDMFGLFPFSSTVYLGRVSETGELVKTLSDEDRGILFAETTKKYLDNQGLLRALKRINKLTGKPKLDLLGMDACLMAMVEVGYQCKDHVKVMVGSQEVELADGWLYAPFLGELAGSKKVSAQELGQNIVLSYDLYYKKKSAGYTQSATNLATIDKVRENMDDVADLISSCKDEYGASTIKRLVRKARKASIRFNTPSYVDLHSFYKQLHSEIDFRIRTRSIDVIDDDGDFDDDKEIELVDTYIEGDFSSSPRVSEALRARVSSRKNPLANLTNLSSVTKPKIDLVLPATVELEGTRLQMLRATLEYGMKLIGKVAFSSVAGGHLKNAKGLSVYYPTTGRIDASYLKTEFAKKSKWVAFLRDNM